jgi:hypothetical protein
MALPRQRGQTLILLAAWLFFGGGAASALVVYERPASEMKKVIKRAMADGARREGILADISQWASTQKKQDKSVSAAREEFLKTLRRQGTARSEVEPMIGKLDQAFLEMDRNYLDLRFHIKVQVTRAEWAEIVARPTG